MQFSPKILYSKRKTLAVSILPDASIVIKAPSGMPLHFINHFLDRNKEWINKRVAVLQSVPTILKRQYKEGEQFWYLGKYYSLHLGNYPSITISEDKLILPVFLQFRAQKELANWYNNQAKLVITRQVQQYAKELKASYLSIGFSDTKSKWGHCTYDNKLQFNPRLIMAPLLVVNYVIVHELVHTTNKDHSRSFWSKVRLYNPSYRQQIKWLKTNGQFLQL